MKHISLSKIRSIINKFLGEKITFSKVSELINSEVEKNIDKNLSGYFGLIVNKYIEIFCKKHNLVFQKWGNGILSSCVFFSEYYLDFEDVKFDIDTNQPDNKIKEWYALNPHFNTLDYKSFCESQPNKK